MTDPGQHNTTADERDAIAMEIICPSCAAPNHRYAEFCVACGMPIGQYVMTDPFKSIEGQWACFRRATDGPPSRVVLIGMWIIFLPAMMTGLIPAAAIETTYTSHTRADFVEIDKEAAEALQAYVTAITSEDATADERVAASKQYDEVMRELIDKAHAPAKEQLAIQWREAGIAIVALIVWVIAMYAYGKILYRTTAAYFTAKHEEAADGGAI